MVEQRLDRLGLTEGPLSQSHAHASALAHLVANDMGGSGLTDISLTALSLSPSTSPGPTPVPGRPPISPTTTASPFGYSSLYPPIISFAIAAKPVEISADICTP